MPSNNSQARRDRRYQTAVYRQHDAHTRRPYDYAPVDTVLRPGDTIGVACAEPLCRWHGDPDMGDGTCPPGHAGPIIEQRRASDD